MMAQSKYGAGKNAALGDSSPPDDGTGANNDVLYNGWTGEVSGDHSKIILNATFWLSNNTLRNGEEITSAAAVHIWPNPFAGQFNLSYFSDSEKGISMHVTDLSGRTVLLQQQSCHEGDNLFHLEDKAFSEGFNHLHLRWKYTHHQ